ncbi:MAG TPA: hypothetical protein VER17_11430 [Tepidisphaeraceae bacterium]|nr:hypothetical protein [Tepidisphaeraceae bacterium]
MAKRSVFRDFMTALKRHWRTALPGVEPLKAARGSLPMASTFDAGKVTGSEQRVYLCFQHNQKVPGEFTVNVILAHDGEEPRYWGVHPDEVRPGETLGDGPRRISQFLPHVRHDKWWHLKRDEHYAEFCRSLGHEFKLPNDYWRPASYDDEQEVIRTAVLDVTRDVQSTLEQLGARKAAGA